MRLLRGPQTREDWRPETTRRVRGRVTAGTLGVVGLAMVAFAVPGCASGGRTQTSEPVTPVVATSDVTTLSLATTTTEEAPPDSAASDWREMELVEKPPAEPFSLRLSDELLVFDTTDDGVLYAYPLMSGRFVRLPVEGRVRAFDVEGSLVVWTESKDLSAPASTWAYRLPDGPRVNLLTEQIDASRVRLDEGRLFYTSWHVVDADGSDGETLYRCPISMLRLDASGRPDGNAVLVTEQPKASHEPGGDELWDFDVSGPNLAYQVDWGPERGTHLLDLDTGGVVKLGVGTIPSISSTAVLWWEVGEDSPEVRGYDLANRQTETLAFRGQVPLAGPDYVAYVQPNGAAEPSEVMMLDRESGARTVLGWWQPPDGWPFLSMDGTDRRFAWVSRSGRGDSQLHLFER